MMEAGSRAAFLEEMSAPTYPCRTARRVLAAAPAVEEQLRVTTELAATPTAATRRPFNLELGLQEQVELRAIRCQIWEVCRLLYLTFQERAAVAALRNE